MLHEKIQRTLCSPLGKLFIGVAAVIVLAGCSKSKNDPLEDDLLSRDIPPLEQATPIQQRAPVERLDPPQLSVTPDGALNVTCPVTPPSARGDAISERVSDSTHQIQCVEYDFGSDVKTAESPPVLIACPETPIKFTHRTFKGAYSQTIFVFEACGVR